MTLDEIAAQLDTFAIDMANALMPTADDPDRAQKAYALGIASHAAKQRADELRKIAGKAAAATGA
jgi:hypothetical protein